METDYLTRVINEAEAAALKIGTSLWFSREEPPPIFFMGVVLAILEARLDESVLDGHIGLLEREITRRKCERICA
jgi:hypothetical protein